MDTSALNDGEAILRSRASEGITADEAKLRSGELKSGIDRGNVSPSPPSLLTTTLSTTRSLILLQLLSRLITFSLNHALLTFASPEVFGTAAIQFDLLGSTLLFLSREGIQGALLRSRTTASDPSPSSSPPSQADDTKGSPSEEKGRSTSGGILSQAQRDQQALNLSLLPLPLFLLLATLILPLYLYYTPSSTLSQPYFRLSLSLHILSNLLELLSEPFHIRLQTLLRLRPRVQAEGAGVIARAVVTLAVVAWGRNAKVGGERALLAFGIGQVVYGLVLLGRFGWEFGWDAWSMWIPRRVISSSTPASTSFINSVPTASDSISQSSTPLVDRPTFSLARSMTLQSFFKHFLTEGDRILVSQVSPLKDQGGYAIATNYGSLIARIVFQPMEEAARLYFARTPLATSPTPSTPSPMTRGSAVAEEDNSAPLILPLLLRLSSHLLLLLPALGPPYIPTLLSLLLPSRSGWSSARLQTPTKILTLYTLYLPLLSLNGLLEAFFASTASPRDLAAQSRSMVGWTAMFVGFVWLWSRGLGWDEPERALVIGNCLGMMGRIGWTVRYAKRRFREVGRRLSVWEMVPGRWAVMVCVGSSVVARLSQARLSSKPPWKEIGMHFGLGGVLGIICLAACVLSERANFRKVTASLRRKKD